MDEPWIEEVDPAFVCLESLPATVNIRGMGFTPVLHNLVGESVIMLPSITLTRVVSFNGSPARQETYRIENEPETGATPIRWFSQEHVQLRVPASLGLEPGIYDLTLENPDGRTAMMKEALLLSRPPEIASVTPYEGCGSPHAWFEIAVRGGPFFILGSTMPLLFFESGVWAYWATGSEGCTGLRLQGGSLWRCGTLTFKFHRGSVSEETGGDRHFFVSASPAGGCWRRSPMTFHLIPCPHITSISPPVACLAQEERTFTITGTELVFERSVPPQVRFGDLPRDVVSLDGCDDVPGTDRMECNTLEFFAPVLDSDMFDPIEVSILNLRDHTCCYTEPESLVVAPIPRIFSLGSEIDPGATPVTVHLAGIFLTWEMSYPIVHFGTESSVTAASVHDCYPVPGISETVSICNSLMVDVPSHLLEHGAEIPLSVSNPDPIGCTSENDAWIRVSGGSP